MSDASSVRLVASSSNFDAADRIDLPIHAAAQLPGTLSIAIRGTGPGRARLEAVTAAYGLERQVDFADTIEDPGGRVLFPSLHNAQTAPLRPAPGDQRPILLDEGRSVGPWETAGSMAELVEALTPRGERVPVSAPVERLAGESIALVTNYPTHYRVPLFNRIASRLAEASATFRVLLTGGDPTARSWMKSEPFAFEYETCRAANLPGSPAGFPVDLTARLRRWRPSVILSGGFSPLVSGRAARFASGAGAAFGVWSGETDWRSTAHGLIRQRQRARLLSRADFAVAYGFRAGEYLRRLAPTAPFVYSRNTAPTAADATPRVAGDAIEVLAVSRAIEGKGIDLLIEAFSLVGDAPARLTIVGAGPDLERLERLAAGDPRITFVGEVPTDETPSYFRKADIFAFPSRIDAFGLVTVEAFASGLAVAISEAPGAVGDLAADRRNCLVVEGESPEAWARALRELIADSELRAGLGVAARATIERRWTIEHSAEGVLAGLVLGASRRR